MARYATALVYHAIFAGAMADSYTGGLPGRRGRM